MKVLPFLLFMEIFAMRFYKVDLDYIKYLHQFDNRVQYNPAYNNIKNQNRPYLGIVFQVDNNNYFAPLEHPRPSHQHLKNNLHIFKINKGKLGIIGLNNMIPVQEQALMEFDIKNEPNYKILTTQYVFCRKHWNFIIDRAKKVYEKQTQSPNDFTRKCYCDFKLLEQKSQEYINQQITQNNELQAQHNTSAVTEDKTILPNQLPDMGGFNFSV